MDQLEDEIREDYLLQVKRAIISFVLKDPSDPNIDGLGTPEEENEKEVSSRLNYRKELAVLPRPWSTSFIASRKFCQTHLNFSNPVLMRILDLWFVHYEYVVSTYILSVG